MAEQERRSKPGVDKDGVKIVPGSGVRTSIWLLVLALALVGVAIFVVIRPALQSSPPAPTTADLAAKAPRTTAVPRNRPQERIPPATAVARAHAAAAVPLEKVAAALQPTLAPGVEATEAGEANSPEATEAAGPTEADQPTGLAVFPPPGTKPIKRGIIVPEGVELPPGYVRHYQTTDDGRQLPPILMFHPDYHPVDGDGNPIPLPEDHVVPPDMAPPGMPIQMLDVPEDGTPAAGEPATGRRAPVR